jgi:hypothetical protein
VLGAYAAKRVVFAPTDAITAMDGLALWLDAADASSLTLVDNRISQWRDRRGASLAMAQNTPGAQAFYGGWTLNGQPVVRFEGNQAMTTSASVPIGTQISIFVVARLTASNTGLNRLINGYTNGWLFVGTDTSDRVATFYGSNSGNWQTTQGNSTTTWLNQWHTVSSVNNGTDSQYINGLASAPRINPMGNFNNPISLGGVFGDPEQYSQMWTGEVAEVLIFSRAVTSDERQMVEVYLAQKWGLTTRSTTPGAESPIACPANPAAAAAGRYQHHDDAGLESRTGSTCAGQVGLLPWQTLGLQRRDAFDGFGQALTYAVTPSAGSAVSVTRAVFCGADTPALDYAADPLRLVIDPTGTGSPTGTAAEVPLVAIISHGQDREGAYSPNRTRPARPDESPEAHRAQVSNYDEGDTPSTRGAQLAAAPLTLNRPAAYFDDLVWSADASRLLSSVPTKPCP